MLLLLYVDLAVFSAVFSAVLFPTLMIRVGTKEAHNEEGNPVLGEDTGGQRRVFIRTGRVAHE